MVVLMMQGKIVGVVVVEGVVIDMLAEVFPMMAVRMMAEKLVMAVVVEKLAKVVVVVRMVSQSQLPSMDAWGVDGSNALVSS